MVAAAGLGLVGAGWREDTGRAGGEVVNTRLCTVFSTVLHCILLCSTVFHCILLCSTVLNCNRQETRVTGEECGGVGVGVG